MTDEALQRFDQQTQELLNEFKSLSHEFKNAMNYITWTIIGVLAPLIIGVGVLQCVYWK